MAWCVLCGTMKTPCVHSKRARVYVQNVPVCTGTTRTCGNTCARGAGTHGDVLNPHTGSKGSSSVLAHVWLSRASEAHRKKPLVLTHSRFENRSRTTSSRVLQSFALPDEAVELHFHPEGHCGGNQHTTHTHTHQHTLTNPPSQRPTHHHSPHPPTRTRTRKRTCTCTCVCVLYVHVCVCV